jgi:hypothetical protein
MLDAKAHRQPKKHAKRIGNVKEADRDFLG